MKALCIVAKASSFKGKDGNEVKGKYLTFLLENDRIKTFFVSEGNEKGWKDEYLTNLFSENGEIEYLTIQTEVTDYKGQLKEKLVSVTA